MDGRVEMGFSYGVCLPMVDHIDIIKEKNPWKSLTTDIPNVLIFLIILWKGTFIQSQKFPSEYFPRHMNHLHFDFSFLK